MEAPIEEALSPAAGFHSKNVDTFGNGTGRNKGRACRRAEGTGVYIVL